MFFDYKKEVDARKAYFDTQVDKFLQQYPTIVETTNNTLGDLYDPADYTSVEELRSKIAFRMVFSPVPEGGDFRVDLPAQDIQEMRAQYDAAFNDRLAEAMREPWDRLHKMLAAMTEKLNQPDDPDTTRRWHDTFITNARDMTEMLRHLNVTKDPELERARRALSDAIYGIDIEDVKHDMAVRENMSRKLTAILDSSW
jgi:hypothetical protein